MTILSLKYVIRFLKILWPPSDFDNTWPKIRELTKLRPFGYQNSDAIPLLCAHRFVESQTYRHFALKAWK